LSTDLHLYRMTRLEVAAGQVLGPSRPVARSRSHAPSPRAALEDAILPALAKPPCLVSFSGGRDSSAILAVATQLARRQGLCAPVPISYRFTATPDAEESTWQELVVRHLGLDDWERLTIGSEFDLVGPLAARVLRRHGVVYPPHAHWSLPLFDAGSGGSLLTGQGGDELLSPWRARRLSAVGWNRRAPWRTGVRAVLEQMPVPVRRAMYRRRLRSTPNSFRLRWLRPAAREQVLDRWAERFATEPLRYQRYLRWCAGWSGRAVAFATLDALAAESQVSLLHPLLDARFVDSLATFGWRGPRDRAEAMRRLFADVLPPAVLDRRTKAVFGGALFSEHSRSFVDRWTGDDVDTELIDAEALRSIWSEVDPAVGTHVLLQNAWLATQRRRTTGPSNGLAPARVAAADDDEEP
jgi:asparagine synthetase B (glutamine-hydrolysing)